MAKFIIKITANLIISLKTSFPRKRESSIRNIFLDTRLRGHDISGYLVLDKGA